MYVHVYYVCNACNVCMYMLIVYVMYVYILCILDGRVTEPEFEEHSSLWTI